MTDLEGAVAQVSLCPVSGQCREKKKRRKEMNWIEKEKERKEII
jgi:hypothetical protein